MSGEIGYKHVATGATLKACLVHPLDRTLAWNGSAFAAWSSMTLTTWRAALVALTEQALSTAEATGVYVGNKPAGVPLPCTVLIYSGASPLPGDAALGVQELGDTDLVDVGNVVSDVGNTVSTFKTNLTGTDDEQYIGRLLIFGSGNAAKEPRRITAFDTGTDFVTVTPALSAVPAADDAFAVLGYVEV